MCRGPEKAKVAPPEPPPRAGKAAGQRSNPVNENASCALTYAAVATQLAAHAALDALRRTNDPAAWALGDAAYWAARAAAQAARALGNEQTADNADEAADEIVALAESVGHVIRR